MYQNLLYYKFVNIDDPEAFVKEHRLLCQELKLLGKILVSKEGVNGCVSGLLENTRKYIETVHKDKRFTDMDFKIGNCEEHTFGKLVVKVRDEIITFNQEIDLNKTADYIEPKELKQLLDSDEEIVLLDARNRYESQMGTFENAITPDIKIFTDFPNAIKDLAHLKEKRIVTFCTGGVRCEKASALLKKQGFSNVQQLHGGILTYGAECGSEHWNGKCFVFDNRLAVDMNDVSAFHPAVETKKPEDVAYFKRALQGQVD